MNHIFSIIEIPDIARFYLSLYPIFLNSFFLSVLSSSFSTPFGEKPSITPAIPLPCLVSATRICRGLAVAA